MPTATKSNDDQQDELLSLKLILSSLTVTELSEPDALQGGWWGEGGGGAVGAVGEEEKREVKDEAQFTNRFSLTASLFLFFFFPIAKLGLL